MVIRLPMSKSGYETLKIELEKLLKTDRMENIKDIERAREHGDLKENAEYHAAKERQSFIEGRIMELKDKLSRAEVIDCTKVNCEKVVFGTVVTVNDLDTDEELVYRILGPEESDLRKGRISVQSPLGSSMLGKSVGDDVQVRTPGGIRQFEIIEITPSQES
ncbi:MAG: transcription elongation factor GreA [Proteobacteria bacterium]|nr:transcription elongation factor GreA [Pseudomonadota bacterium]MBU1736609.1 transcription elongation factor GreA [Pseudomonadota bacterium]